jgi:acetate kinase
VLSLVKTNYSEFPHHNSAESFNMSTILTLNAGSSSIKFSVYLQQQKLAEFAAGQVENLGPAARINFDHQGHAYTRDIGSADHKVAIAEILNALEPVLKGQDGVGHEVVGVGHRVVHGGVEFEQPVLLTPAVIDKLTALTPLAPLHQPHNLAAIAAAVAAFPDVPQVACFDTAFHRNQPWVNDVFAIPNHFYDEGVRRYGFHGLSYDYITTTLRQRWPVFDQSKVIIAHLGNGASMCAILNGRSVGSTMGFSALDGLPMGTRCGQLDPGVLLYLMDKGLSRGEISTILYKESGLKGLSGFSSDMRELLASDKPRAKQAIDYYVYRIRREIGAMTTTMGGLDALVFCGGIGENSPDIREMILHNMEYLGLELDPQANQSNSETIGLGETRALVIPTDEERVIARAVAANLKA